MATKAIDAPRHTSSGLKTKQRRIRKIFGNIHEISEMPNLIEVQRESYEQFLRSDPSVGYVSGLEKTLRSAEVPHRRFDGDDELSAGQRDGRTLDRPRSAEVQHVRERDGERVPHEGRVARDCRARGTSSTSLTRGP